MNSFNKKINAHFAGKVVRKDLTKQIKGNAIVPTYVLEYLLARDCATDDDGTIKEGLKRVKDVISHHFVHRDESQIIKSTIKEKGKHRIIDRVSIRLNDREDRYEAFFANLGLVKIPISDEVVRKHRKLLSSGVWCIITLGYIATDERISTPWVVEQIKPIQISNVDIEEYKSLREHFTTDQWMNLLLQTIGLNPSEFTKRSKLIQIARLVPFVENNYNLIELGPKGTGKSHVYSEFSPHGILISGGEVTKAKLFVNNRTKEIGLVGYWDVVAYDEFAGKNKKIERGLVDIMKNYMANKFFSRGTEVIGASASMVFVGNTDHSVAYMMRHSNLFDALSKDYYDTALLDRIHAYLPGWEIQKLRNDMFASDYGFIVDYLAEVLKELRKEDRTKDYCEFFVLSDSITTRDRTSIEKTYAGLSKIIYPNGRMTQDEAKVLMEFSIESRKRVKDHIRKMEDTFEEVNFSYSDKGYNKFYSIQTLEEIEYGGPMKKETEVNDDVMLQEEIAPNNVSDKEFLKEGQKIIRDNQSGISFDILFGAYLAEATKIKLIDPYIRFPYQLRNFMEFVRLIIEKRDSNQEIALHLVTSNEEVYIEGVKEKFHEIADSLKSIGINFSFEFGQFIHDRSIEMNNGWKIVLGRGLDIWQKTGGLIDLADYIQERRLCKGCEITFVRQN